MRSVLLDIEGMKCGGCVQAVEKILLNQPNISQASVNLVTRSAYIDLKGTENEINQVIKALGDRGFQAKERILDTKPLSKSEVNANKNWGDNWRKLFISIILLLLSVIGHLANSGTINLPILGALPFHAAIATFAVFGPGYEILKSGYKSAINLMPSMDTLVGL